MNNPLLRGLVERAHVVGGQLFCGGEILGGIRFAQLNSHLLEGILDGGVVGASLDILTQGLSGSSGCWHGIDNDEKTQSESITPAIFFQVVDPPPLDLTAKTLGSRVVAESRITQKEVGAALLLKDL